KIYPEIDDDKCVRCEVCLRSCPEKAIDKFDGRMKINYKKCISCYCCHELCPQKAVMIKKNRLADILWLARD
ncbi:MAG TPA: 4Fe-4S binding protein, partial [bacterium]|nr:4Fe-4S binding protein [bacterium]